MSERKKLLVIDGNSILNRAFYGIRPLTTHDGRRTEAVYGFLNIILKQLDSLSPDAAAVAFDLKEKTFRHERFEGYKATRKGMPDELFSQLEPSKEALRLLGLHVLSLAGYEADDILGTCAEIAKKETDCDCYILTGDRDSLQLVSDNCFVLLATNTETVFYDIAKISENYCGLSPEKLIDIKALMGDSSDNIPGVPGIGEKTAIKLICEYGSLDHLYEKFEDSSLSEGIKTKLRLGKDSAYMSRSLAEICRTVPLNLSFADLLRKEPDKAALRSFLTDLELKKLIDRLGLNNPEGETEGKGAKAKKPIAYKRLSSLPDCGEAFAYLDFDRETVYLFSGELLILPLNKETVSGLLTDATRKTVLYDCKRAYRYLLSNGVDQFDCAFDLMLARYLLSPSGKNDPFDLLNDSSNEFDLSGSTLSDHEQKCLLLAKAMPELTEKYKEAIAENGQNRLYFEVELPLAKTLANMEHFGFKLDIPGLSAYSKKLDVRLAERTENIYRLAGREFNINSPKQLGEILFHEMKLPSFKKTKSGFSTDAETLEKLRPYHPIIDEVLEYRAVAKLKSTYAEGLLKVADKKSGRIHTNFNQTLTVTGRLSSTEPNLQNIPIRQAEGRELRKFFIPESDESVLIDADYSQIELRILAAISGDEAMIRAFNEGEDIHRITASQVFGVAPSEVTDAMRKSAKAVNFGIVYGISDFSLAGDIHVSVREAGEYINRYFKKYPKVKEYLDRTVEEAIKNGYVTTMFGRRRYIPELSAKNKQLQAFGKRVAMNSPIQGTAADIIKIAMVNTEKALKNANLSSRLILQVHDELIIEAPKEEAEAALRILKKEMEGSVSLSVPMSVSLSCGKNWFEAHT